MTRSRASVLVGFAGAVAAPEVAASLIDAGYRVACFTRRHQKVALGQMRGVELVAVTAPEHDFDASTREVAAAARAHDVIMPLDDPAVLVCDRALPSGALVAGPRGPLARFALDKREQLRAAAAAGFEVPAWTELRPEWDPPEGWELPAMMKPALAAEMVSGRLRRLSPRLVATAAEFHDLRRAWGLSTPAIVQRWVQGQGRGIFGLADDGYVHHLSAHRRVRMMNPAGSGSSACASGPVPATLRDPLAHFLGAAQWNGMFMVELLRSDGRWWFMELNGRPWGSLALARRLGYEYPAWAVARVLDPLAALPPAPPFVELQCRHLGRELVHLLFVLRGSGSYVGAWPGRAATVRALLKRNGATSWYNLSPGMRGVFLNDAWRTVVEQARPQRRS